MRSALERATPVVYSRAAELIKQLRKRQNQRLDISTWLEYYTFDVMGLFGLTIDFKNLTEGEHPILGIYHMAHHLLGPLAAVPWMKHLLMGIPFIERMKHYKRFFSWAHDELARNIKVSRNASQSHFLDVLLGLPRDRTTKKKEKTSSDTCLAMPKRTAGLRQTGTLSWATSYLSLLRAGKFNNWLVTRCWHRSTSIITCCNSTSLFV